MKRANRLFDQIVERENMRWAFHRAAKGKRDRETVRSFARQLEEQLNRIQIQLAAGTFTFGRFRQFTIYDPKQRTISAPCFEERVVHHAIMNVCEPVFERWLIADSFACRLGLGREAAMERASAFSRRWLYFLKLDMRRYFDSIEHGVLVEKLRRRFKDAPLLELFQRIIRSYHVKNATPTGLPIGALTSQHFANFFLGWFDRFVKERLRVQGYVRYMDDCVLWGDSARELDSRLREARGFLRDELKLELKKSPFINRVTHGFDFLGARIFPYHRTLNRRSRVRFRRGLLRLETAFLAGRIEEAELQRRSDSLFAFARSGSVKSWQMRSSLIKCLPVSGRRARTG